MENNAPKCPKCGSPMVVKTAQKGANTGKQFYGCTMWSKTGCKGTAAYNPDYAGNQPYVPTNKAPASAMKRQWYYANVLAPKKNLQPGDIVAMAKLPNDDWEYFRLEDQSKGLLSKNELKNVVQSIRKDGMALSTYTPSLMDYQRINPPEKEEPKTPDNGQLSREKMSEEQRKIDMQFEKIMQSPGMSHLMIAAGAGTGKTTMLKHLAWKYGKPGQKWLYIVFNTKNKVEAKEKFPPFVDVHTSNSFTGDMLGEAKNGTRIHPTDRMVNLSNYRGSDEDTNRLEKARLIADSPELTEFLKQLGINTEHVKNPDLSQYMNDRISKLLSKIRYNLKEEALLLLNLGKSFAVNTEKDTEAGLKKIMDSYDIDTFLENVKEGINGTSASLRRETIYEINSIIKDFMDRDFSKEIMQLAIWLMKETSPGGTSQKYRQGVHDHELSDFRDFNDDLWYVATHADKLHWPKYDIVLADEVQDFNEAQKIVLKKLQDQGAKIVAVGDENQAIYRFRGADAAAFKNIGTMLSDLSDDKDNVHHTLSYNYRSRKAVLDFAAKETHVKNLKQGKTFTDGDGAATKYDVKYGQAFDEIKNEKNKTGKIKQTAFIARTNEPLVHASLRLLADNVPFVILGKDLAKDLRKYIDKVLNIFRLKDSQDIREFREKMEEFRTQEMDRHEGKSTKKVYLAELNEITEALLSAMDQFMRENQAEYLSTAQFKAWIKARLSGLDVQENEADLKKYRQKEKENPVVLTTAHRSKGLEFSRVYILRYDQFPHKKAKRQEDKDQEANAKYVALTRAMDEIHVLDLPGQPGYKDADDEKPSERSPF